MEYVIITLIETRETRTGGFCGFNFIYTDLAMSIEVATGSIVWLIHRWTK